MSKTSVYRVWVLSFMTVVAAVRQPPVITNFPTNDLINPDEVKFNQPNGFIIPCGASGSNLTWSWKHNQTDITMFYGNPYSLSQNGTLTGSYLTAKNSGTYQCIVKDQVTGIQVFSRKIKVAVTVIGEFLDNTNLVQKVDLGQPFTFQCPGHHASYGAMYSWVGSQNIQFSRNKRRGISPDGGLYFTYVIQQDFDEIRDKKGIRCKISGANSFRDSGILMLEKNDEQQTDPKTPVLPSWAIRPKALELAIEGREKTLYCLAAGRPAPTITWRKNGQPIASGSDSFEIPTSFHGRRLNINSVKRAKHEDQYTCEAANELNKGNPIIQKIRLVVEVAPKWSVKPPPKMNIVFATNGTLECQVTADPPALVTWYKNGVKLVLSDEHVTIHGNKLEFIDVILNNEGVYQCTAENRHGMIASATWVHVQAWKPSFLDEQFGPFHLLHDSEGRLQCNPSAAPKPSFHWFRNGVEVTYGTSSRYNLQKDGTLVIKKVDKENDAINFTCRATNFVGEDSATAVAIVFVRPSFVRKPTNQKVTERQIVTFHCTVSGYPTPNITWVKDGQTLRSTGETLRIRTERYHSGKYWCEAENGFGSTIRAAAELDVQFPPSFTTKPNDQTVNENDTVTFNCAATGHPTPGITWIKDGMTVGTENNLTFTAALRNDSGKYWCIAENGLNVSVEESAYLDVHYKPENTKLVVNTANPIAVPFGSKIIFTCTSNSHPDVQGYRFYRNQELLGTSTTVIFQVTIGHSGLYSCIPFNDVGDGEKADIAITVDGTPDPPSKLQITDLDCTEWTVKLSWIPGAPQGAPVDYYLVEEASSGDPVNFAFVFNVTDPHAQEASFKLSGKSVPRLRMKAFNQFGASRPSLTTEEAICSTKPPTEVGLKRAKATPVYSRAWFLTVVALAAYIALFLVAFILVKKYRHGRGHKYNVKIREKKYGVVGSEEKQDKKPKKEEEQQDEAEEVQKPFLENNNQRKGPPKRYSRPLSNYSMLEENLFGEDASFADEYKETDVVFTYEKEGTFV